MKVAWLVCIWVLLLISCKEVSFTEPQPNGVSALKEIPVNLRGYYLSYDERTGEESDTLIIESWGYHFKDKENNDWLGKGKLSDSLVVKFYQNYYFVNFKSGDQWVLRLVKQLPSGGIEFLSIDIQDDSRRKEIIRKISRKMKFREVHRGDDTYYQISPTTAQLMELIHEGFFTGSQLDKIQ